MNEHLRRERQFVDEHYNGDVDLWTSIYTGNGDL